MSYRIYPTDYVQELNQKGLRGRIRAMAFMSYWNDLEFGEHQSVSFYATSWSCSKSTAWEWIEEFKKEVDKFLAHWELKNNLHYKSAKKSTERTERNEPNQVFNLTTNAISDERLFEDLFFIYSQNTKHAGKKSEAREAYLKVKHDATHDDFKRAIFFYLHDPKHNFQAEPKLFNAKNFFAEGAYYGYIPKHIRIINHGTWLTGVYDADSEQVTASGGVIYGLPDAMFKKKFASGELEFIREIAA